MKRIIIGGVLVALMFGLAYATMQTNTAKTVTSIVANKDSIVMTSDPILMNDPGYARAFPKYQSVAMSVIIAKPDTSIYGTTADGNPMRRDSAQVRVYANFGSFRYPVYTQTITTSVPDTLKLVLVDTGAASILFHSDDMLIDAYSVDTSGAGAADTLVHSFWYHVKLIGRRDY